MDPADFIRYYYTICDWNNPKFGLDFYFHRRYFDSQQQTILLSDRTDST